MEKTLSERIAVRTKATSRTTKTNSARNRSAFRRVQDDIKLALDDGWPVKLIWETLHEEKAIAFSYQTFRVYTNELVLCRRKKSVLR
ncbi:TraK family protein [Collimonas sp. H4R21]|uniref:TraK family protein n=1 Tax=Collimonas rhizosphaerae TaxID=3126357 RepID=A0ABU9PWR4_9BURK